jgi:hypothetical protein
LENPISDLQYYRVNVIEDIERLTNESYDDINNKQIIEERELQRDIGLNDLKDELLMIDDAINMYSK